MLSVGDLEFSVDMSSQKEAEGLGLSQKQETNVGFLADAVCT